MNKWSKAVQYPAIFLLAVLSALNYAIFIFPNSFAPAGVDGICTMIQDIAGFSMGYLSLLVNVPLLIAAFIWLDREFTLKTAVYVVSFSAATILLRGIDLSAFVYHSESGTSIVLAPIAAGAIRGVLYAFTIRLNGSSGGTDIVAALVKKRKPYLELMNVIFIINMGVALSAYFVYGFKPEPVICSIIYSFITSATGNHLRAAEHEMVRFEVITPEAEQLCMRIFDELRRTATIVDARGAYSGEDEKMIVCVIERKKVPELEAMVKGMRNTVYFKSVVL
ncbi:MAG: YitT family protein [Clostridia bacterium]|nr:YitT family protein [Clostridia bacterium]